ncbi:MAG: hypothetical protein MJ147_09790 [Clostridia bacterium]|nr:hypothetical protein [Clostridia bacterium]
MKTTKSILAIILAILVAFSSVAICASAENPKITNIKWNDDYSIRFSFDGAKEYRWSIYVNNNMIWGYGSTQSTSQSRERMLPYMAAIAKAAMESKGYSGDVSFDFKIVANDADGNSISSITTVSKKLKIEDVANGKLASGDELWEYCKVNTSDKTKLREAILAAYEPERAMIEQALKSANISYDQYMNGVITSAGNDAYYTFKGTLGQVMRFSYFYSNYGYTDISYANKAKEISEVNVSINIPKHGQKVSNYIHTANVVSQTAGVNVTPVVSSKGIYEITTSTYQSKFYSKNLYQIGFVVSYQDGYVPAENVCIKVNGIDATYAGTTIGTYEGVTGYYCTQELNATGNFFQNIGTFFHNIFAKLGK